KPLHLAYSFFQFVQSNTPCGLLVCQYQEQHTFRENVVARQTGQFLFEALKTEIEIQAVRVLEKELAHRGNPLPVIRKDNDVGHPFYPINIPPFTFKTCPVM